MSILTRVLIGLVILATFPVLYLAAQVLNVQNEWHRKIKDLEAAIQKQDAQFKLLTYGDFDAQTHALVPGKPIVGTPGELQWKTARDNIMRGAGRVWYARPQAASISAETGAEDRRLCRRRHHRHQQSHAAERSRPRRQGVPLRLSNVAHRRRPPVVRQVRRGIRRQRPAPRHQ
ncbi:MAG: hypothetical protein QM775_01870 [Pirellulales bacterium]